MKRSFAILITLLILASALLTACADTGIQQNEIDTDWQLGQYNKVQRIHFYTYSWERWIVQTLYDFRVTKLSPTWAVALANGTGEPIDMCSSKGFGIPYNTSLTNSDQVVYSGTTVAMMEPNGLYPGGSTSATWVLCVEADGTLHPWYVESDLMVYDHPVSIAFDTQRGMYRIIRAGTASADTQILIPTNVNPQVLTEPSAP